MLSKCTNPGCAARFLYLHQGKLFRWEAASAAGDNDPGLSADAGMKMRVRRTEFFWLCADCAVSMTLTFDRNGRITIHPLKCAAAAAS
jgi:hypothetical protein